MILVSTGTGSGCKKWIYDLGTRISCPLKGHNVLDWALWAPKGTPHCNTIFGKKI